MDLRCSNFKGAYLHENQHVHAWTMLAAVYSDAITGHSGWI